MKITPELIDRLSVLARLCLPEEEKAREICELERIVAYMGTLNELDLADGEPVRHILGINDLRGDEPAPSLERAELLKNAPEQDGETFLVPRTVE